MKKPFIQELGIWSDYPIIQRQFYDSLDILSKYSFAQFDDTTVRAGSMPDLINWAAKFNSSDNNFKPESIKGIGAYQLQSWQPGESIILEKKKNHWSDNSENYFETGIPEKIIFNINHDATSQILKFSGQEYDGSAYIGIRSLFQLQEKPEFNKNYFSKFMDTYGYTYIGLNMKPDGSRHLPLLTDVQVRKALALATPVSDLIKIINHGINKRANGPVSSLKKSNNKNIPLIPFDISAASKLLDVAGWKDSDGDGVRDKIIDGKKISMELELAYLTSQVEWKEMSLMISEAMGKAGVKVNPVAYDFPLWIQKATSHDFDMIIGSWNASSGIEEYDQLWGSSNWATNGPNYTGFGDANSDAILDSLNFVFDEHQRFDLEQRMQQKIADDQPYIFLYQLVRRCVIHKRFAGSAFYAERPGIMYNNLHLSSAPMITNSSSAQ